MDTTVKLRVSSSELDRWKARAGHRGVSAWLREIAARELREPRLAVDARRLRNQPPGPPPVHFDEAPPERPGTCRHGLHNCSVCGWGAFSGKV